MNFTIRFETNMQFEEYSSQSFSFYLSVMLFDQTFK